jgi:tetratricopeptide (TPR) repeat protein
MGNFFKSIFSSTPEDTPEEAAQKAAMKNFDIFKYDGVRAMRIGQMQYAIKCFIEALKIREDREVEMQLLQAYVSLHKLEEAWEVADRMVTAEPEEYSWRLSRATLASRIDRADEALQDCLFLVEADTKEAEVYMTLGSLYLDKGETESAIVALTKAIELNNELAEPYRLRCVAFMKLHEQLDKAMADAEEYIRLTPENEQAYILRGRLHEQDGKPEKAEEDYSMAIEYNPFCEEAFRLRSKVRSLLGDETGAAEDAEAANEIAPVEEPVSAPQASSGVLSIY